MNIKTAIIKTNDVLAYIAFAAVLIIGMVMIIGGNIGAGLAFLVGGWVACSLVFGLWFCLSEIADNLRKIANK